MQGQASTTLGRKEHPSFQTYAGAQLLRHAFAEACCPAVHPDDCVVQRCACIHGATRYVKLSWRGFNREVAYILSLSTKTQMRTCHPVPDNGGLSLVGYAQRHHFDGPHCCLCSLHSPADAFQHSVPYLQRVVLHPTEDQARFRRSKALYG